MNTTATQSNQTQSEGRLIIRVAVGSSNPCKINAARRAFEEVFSAATKRELLVVMSSYNVPSGVSDQPFGDAETRLGAMNRAKAAHEAACSWSEDKNEHPDFSVGLEGGLEKQSHPQADELWCNAWVAVFSSEESWGFAKSGSFLLPPALCDLVLNEGMELGDADDIVFKRVNSKHGQGTVGKLTDGQIDRASFYVHALKLALIPWVRPELYLRRDDKR
jgi:inosine/xanthosine triphosphatase